MPRSPSLQTTGPDALHTRADLLSKPVSRLLQQRDAAAHTPVCLQLLVLEDIFQVASINRLLRFVGIITAQYVGVEPREICQTRWNQWQRLTGDTRTFSVLSKPS